MDNFEVQRSIFMLLRPLRRHASQLNSEILGYVATLERLATRQLDAMEALLWDSRREVYRKVPGAIDDPHVLYPDANVQVFPFYYYYPPAMQAPGRREKLLQNFKARPVYAEWRAGLPKCDPATTTAGCYADVLNLPGMAAAGERTEVISYLDMLDSGAYKNRDYWWFNTESANYIRACMHLKQCVEEAETPLPTTAPPAPVDCVLSTWSAWSLCSATACGTSGISVRTRTIMVAPANGGASCGVLEEQQPCQAPTCPPTIAAPPGFGSGCPLDCGAHGRCTFLPTFSQLRLDNLILHGRRRSALPSGAIATLWHDFGSSKVLNDPNFIKGFQASLFVRAALRAENRPETNRYAQNWFNWYLSHLEADGTFCEHEIRSGVEQKRKVNPWGQTVPCYRESSAMDGGAFLLAVSQYVDSTEDSAFVLSHIDNLAKVFDGILVTRSTYWLTQDLLGKNPEYTIPDIDDQSVAWSGISEFARVLGLLSGNQKAVALKERMSNYAAILEAAIERHYVNPSTGLYYWRWQAEVPTTPQQWVTSLYPMIFGLPQAAARKDAAWKAFKQTPFFTRWQNIELAQYNGDWNLYLIAGATAPASQVADVELLINNLYDKLSMDKVQLLEFAGKALSIMSTENRGSTARCSCNGAYTGAKCDTPPVWERFAGKCPNGMTTMYPPGLQEKMDNEVQMIKDYLVLPSGAIAQKPFGKPHSRLKPDGITPCVGTGTGSCYAADTEYWISMFSMETAVMLLEYDGLTNPETRLIVRKYMDWYLRHLEPNGLLYDWMEKGGIEWTNKYIDGVDANAATFMMLVGTYLNLTNDVDWLLANWVKIKLVIDTLFRCEQPTGLTGVSPAFEPGMQYHMDNTGTHRALSWLVQEFRRLRPNIAGLDEIISQMDQFDSRNLDAIEALLWDPRRGVYRTVPGAVDNPSVLYADGMLQMGALYMFLPMALPRKEALWQNFKSRPVFQEWFTGNPNCNLVPGTPGFGCYAGVINIMGAAVAGATQDVVDYLNMLDTGRYKDRDFWWFGGESMCYINAIMGTRLCALPTSQSPPAVPSVDCVVSEWLTGKCDATCGSGSAIQTRTIIVEPLGGGKSCPPLVQTVPCVDLPSCEQPPTTTPSTQSSTQIPIVTEAPVDCSLSDWVDAGACSVACGGGWKDQERQVLVFPRNNGAACPTELTRSVACNTEPCPENPF